MFPNMSFAEIYGSIMSNLPWYAKAEGQQIMSVEPFHVKEKVLGLRRARTGFKIIMSDGGIEYLYHSFAGVFSPAKVGCHHDGPTQEYWFLGQHVLTLTGGDMGPGYNGVRGLSFFIEFLGFEPSLYESAWAEF